MHRTASTLFGLGALAAVSCGAPAELDENQFPELGATGYADLAGSGGVTNGLPPSNPPAVATVGMSTPMAAGTTGAPEGGAANVTSGTGGAAPPIAGGAAGTSGATSPGGSGACPDDITLLFNRPIQQGGCAGSACHIPGATSPDLVSPNPEQRLLNVTSQCNGIPYIGSSTEDSFVAAKLTMPPRDCGFTMPYLMPQALSAEDKACILAWIDEISGG